MKTKKFDCVEMKHKGARKVYAATRGMTVDEEVMYWRQRTNEARRWLAAPLPLPRLNWARRADRAETSDTSVCEAALVSSTMAAFFCVPWSMM